ncbi:ATP-binding protein [Dyadobacter psychrophilus]|uniref:histidine kinase n=1 Tax=Dyadobacter psychrophilus TaxID=651661 RepID=A0A1T5FQM0_9BACT|nr:ATP-binding protein [Dyadobacter psychrophilus]SKB98400.1 Bacteriophytochrome (light-regulated signal transduction histidine kinase) [Dyadobacter psychrophilus]
MNIKNIVNRDLVNLTNCESEPIHIPGSIQPHGFMLGVNSQNYLIDFCSENCAEYIGIPPQMILGKTLTDIFPAQESDGFKEYAAAERIDSAKPFVFSKDDISYNTTVHKSNETLILELEPFPDGTVNLPNLYNQTRTFVSIMEKTSYLPELCQEIANETRAITGYDRVMIYKFDPGYNGEVIAESKRQDLNSFAGQKYPHTDIPVQARELYIRNPLRMIADINYTPVPILTLDDASGKTNKSLDLSLSILRSVSPIHIEYLKNMGVGATLTISLLQNQKLWGLIACHHYSPKILPHYTRLSALLHGHFLTSQIAVREVAEEFEVSQKVDKSLADLLSKLHENENFVEEYYRDESLLKLANATGAAIFLNNKLYKNGITPADGPLISLFHFLADNFKTQGLVTHALSHHYPEGRTISQQAAGIVYHALSGNSDGIIWMRQEKVETINWAGNPDKAVLPNEEGLRLSPRKSFELWMQVVKDEGAPWRKSEINAASGFSYALQKHINYRVIQTQEDANRALNEELKTANQELANLNWISTHDLKEPLRKIQIFASKVLDREDPDLSAQVKDSVGRMRLAAEKMQNLIEDILAYSKAGNMEKVFEEIDLNIILKNVLRELQDNIEERHVTIHAQELPTLRVIPFQIHQLFLNLISNAIKFTDPDTAPDIDIKVNIVDGSAINEIISPLQKFYGISFKDNGIGFDAEYETRIFDVFQRLHPAHKYPGTGIGLAICKKIAENHKGLITARSESGNGSTFTLFLPVSLS